MLIILLSSEESKQVECCGRRSKGPDCITRTKPCSFTLNYNKKLQRNKWKSVFFLFSSLSRFGSRIALIYLYGLLSNYPCPLKKNYSWLVEFTFYLPYQTRLFYMNMNFSSYFFPHRNSYSSITQSKTIKLMLFKLENSLIWHLFTLSGEQLL